MRKGRKRSEALRVINLRFNDIFEPESWMPDEPWDMEEWVTVTVGDASGGSDFQVHVCTPTSMTRIDDKKGLFVIDAYAGLDDLIARLNNFISDIESDPTHDPMHRLAEHWLWEYSDFKGN